MVPSESPGDSAANVKPGRFPRMRAGLILGVVVLVGMLALGDAERFMDTLGSFEAGVLLPVLGLSLVGYGLRLLKWWFYMGRLGVNLPFLRHAHVFFAGLVMAISPGKVGEVLKSALLKDAHGVPVARTAPAVIAERLTDLLALVLLAGFGSVEHRFGGWILLASVLMALAVLIPAAWEPAGRWAVGALGRMPLISDKADALEEARLSLRALVAPSTLLITTLLSLGAWGAEAVGAWLVIEAFAGCAATLGEATFIFSLSTLAGAVSMLPGGLVATEGSMVALLLGGFSVAPTSEGAAGITLVVRACTLWFGVGLGALALLLWMNVRDPSPDPAKGLDPGEDPGGMGEPDQDLED